MLAALVGLHLQAIGLVVAAEDLLLLLLVLAMLEVRLELANKLVVVVAAA